MKQFENLPSIKTDLKCPTCGGDIDHKRFDVKDNPHVVGEWWNLYLCEPCELQWVPNYIKEFNARPIEEQERIRLLKKYFKQLTEPEMTLEEIVAELGVLGEQL